MEWIVKYEDYSGEVHVVTVSGYDERHAISKIIGCKEVYSSRPVDVAEKQQHKTEELWKS